MPRVTIEASGIPSMGIGIVLREDCIFTLWNFWVSRYLDVKLLSSLYVLLCISPFQEMSYFLKVFGQGILFSPNLQITLGTMNILGNIGEIALSGRQSESFFFQM